MATYFVRPSARLRGPGSYHANICERGPFLEPKCDLRSQLVRLSMSAIASYIYICILFIFSLLLSVYLQALNRAVRCHLPKRSQTVLGFNFPNSSALSCANSKNTLRILITIAVFLGGSSSKIKHTPVSSNICLVLSNEGHGRRALAHPTFYPAFHWLARWHLMVSYFVLSCPLPLDITFPPRACSIIMPVFQPRG